MRLISFLLFAYGLGEQAHAYVTYVDQYTEVCRSYLPANRASYSEQKLSLRN